VAPLSLTATRPCLVPQTKYPGASVPQAGPSQMAPLQPHTLLKIVGFTRTGLELEVVGEGGESDSGGRGGMHYQINRTRRRCS
jgi:hypothetical protein